MYQKPEVIFKHVNFIFCDDGGIEYVCHRCDLFDGLGKEQTKELYEVMKKFYETQENKS